jgi:hypothetical protein
MKNSLHLSRRNFLIIGLTSLSAFLASCSEAVKTAVKTLAPTDTPLPTDTPQPSAITTPAPTKTQTPTSTQTNTPTPSETLTPACLKLLKPEDGAELTTIGRVTFEWEAFDGAAKYKLEIKTPNGSSLTYETSGTSYELYLAVMPQAGEYSWKMTAVDGADKMLCEAELWKFSKPELPPSATPEVGKEGSNMDGKPPVDTSGGGSDTQATANTFSSSTES